MDIKCNNSQLSQIISWSSSRYNEYKKSYVIKSIITHVTEGIDGEWEWESGVYSESVHQRKWAMRKCKNTGGIYKLIIKDGISILIKNGTEEFNIKI